MTATFVLPQHAKKETLKTLFGDFKTRLRESGRADILIKGMSEALTNCASHCLIYWPLQNDEWHTKTCVYDQVYERGKQSAVCFHLVYLTTLLASLNKTVTRFIECQCHNHSRDIAFNWQEFIYPQFVQLMLQRGPLVASDTESISMPPTPPSPISLKKNGCDTRLSTIHHIELRAHQHWNTELTQLLNDAFCVPSAMIVNRYRKEAALAQYGSDTLDGARHYKLRPVSIDNHKLLFTLENVKVRIPLLFGGSLELKACEEDAPPYVVVCTNFTLRMPPQGGHKVYHVYVPNKVTKPRELVDADFGAKRRIECRELCGEAQPCMIVSRAPLRIEFKGNGCLLLATSGACKFDLERAFLEMWTHSPKYQWPCAYEIENVDRGALPLKWQDRRYYMERIHATYYELFVQSDYSLRSPCIGHVTFERASLYDKVVRTTPNMINQYGTMCRRILPPPRCAGIDLINMRVHFRDNEMPLFFTRDGKALLLVEETYEFAGTRYILHGLCVKKGDPIVCFFKLSARRDYLLFIPVEL